MGIAEAYRQYVDPDMGFTDEEVEEWLGSGMAEWTAGRVASLVQRWRLMNLYLVGGFERPETARVARQVARSTCSWLMKVAEVPAYDWTYRDGSGLMQVGREDLKELRHAAASLDIVAWLGRWREDALAAMCRFCSLSEVALKSGSRADRKRVNRICNAIDREVEGVAHALKQDEAKPRKHARSDAEEEEDEA